MTEFDYDIKIKIPVELRLWDKDGKEVTDGPTSKFLFLYFYY